MFRTAVLFICTEIRRAFAGLLQENSNPSSAIRFTTFTSCFQEMSATRKKKAMRVRHSPVCFPDTESAWNIFMSYVITSFNNPVWQREPDTSESTSSKRILRFLLRVPQSNAEFGISDKRNISKQKEWRFTGNPSFYIIHLELVHVNLYL